jgi:ABC-type transport system involved in cytochrome c biogenesis permease subunit
MTFIYVVQALVSSIEKVFFGLFCFKLSSQFVVAFLPQLPVLILSSNWLLIHSGEIIGSVGSAILFLGLGVLNLRYIKRFYEFFEQFHSGLVNFSPTFFFWHLVRLLPIEKEKKLFDLSSVIDVLKIMQKERSVLKKYFNGIKVLFFFLITGQLTGSLWAMFAWGCLWSWDPKETWMTIVLLVLALNVHYNMSFYTEVYASRPLLFGGILALSFCSIVLNVLGLGMHTYGMFSFGS